MAAEAAAAALHPLKICRCHIEQYVWILNASVMILL
jgi:hypothetical protein